MKGKGKEEGNLTQKIQELASGFNNFQCVECAQKLEDFLEKEGKKYGLKSATKITLMTEPDRVGHIGIFQRITFNDKLISETGLHIAIKIDNIIYDNLHPNGISKAEWEKGFERLIPPNPTTFGGYKTFYIGKTTIKPK